MLRPQQRVSRNSFRRSVISVVKISTNVNCVQPRTLFVITAARKDTLELPVNLQNTIFLGAVLNGKTNAKDWTVDVSVGNTEIKFKVDTGADVDIISDDVYGKYSCIDQELLFLQHYDKTYLKSYMRDIKE